MTGWTGAQLKHWRHLFALNAREGYGREPTPAEREQAARLREMGWSPHRAAAEVYEEKT